MLISINKFVSLFINSIFIVKYFYIFNILIIIYYIGGIKQIKNINFTKKQILR